MRLTVNAPPPPAEPRDLVGSFDDLGDDLGDDFDTGELIPGADAPQPASGADDARAGRRRKGIPTGEG